MLKAENAIRTEVKLRGKIPRRYYIFPCIDCRKEIFYEKGDLKKRIGRCLSCNNRKNNTLRRGMTYKKYERRTMFGTIYDKIYDKRDSPQLAWTIASSLRRETWLNSRGFRRIWSRFKYHELPMYIQLKWETEHDE